MRWLPFVVIMVLLMGCGGNDAEPAIAEPMWLETDTVVVWNCNAAQQTRSRIYNGNDTVDLVQPLVNGVNQAWPEVTLKVVGMHHDTVDVTIEDPARMNQMGSSGAEQYLSFMAMNLLEARGINAVQVLLPRGTHSGAAVWTRDDFRNWRLTVNNN